jgi:hypothetical protein
MSHTEIPNTVPVTNVTSTSPEKKELRINSNENSKRVMYLIKEYLLNNDYVELVSGTGGAPVSVRASESLVRLGYVTYECVRTDTTLVNNRRRTKFIVRIRRTEDFKKLYDENEEIRRRTQEINNIN